MKRFAIALAATLVSLSALAADLPVKAPLVATPPLTFNWSGCYMGMLAGGTPGTNNQSSGPTAGGLMGCNYQVAGSSFVYGFEGSMIGSDFASNLATLANIKAIGDLGIRIGYAATPNLALGPVTIRNILVYAKATGAAADMSTPLAGGAWRSGAGVAGGVEIPITLSTTMRYQVDWVDVDNVKSTRYTMGMAVYGSPM